MDNNIPKHSWWHQREELEAFARTFDETARLRVKKSVLWSATRAIKTFATTIGRVIYIPVDWSASSVRSVIPHEVAGHIRQFRWAGFGIHPNLGIFPGMFLVYVWGTLLPVFLAWGRYRCELHADAQSWKYHLERGLWDSTDVRRRAERFADVVSGFAYIWAWPKAWCLAGFKKRAEQVIQEHSSGNG